MQEPIQNKIIRSKNAIQEAVQSLLNPQNQWLSSRVRDSLVEKIIQESHGRCWCHLIPVIAPLTYDLEKQLFNKTFAVEQLDVLKCLYVSRNMYFPELPDLNINIKDNSSWMQLHFAAWYGNTCAAQVSVEDGNVYIDAQDDKGNTPLLLAAKLGIHVSTVQYLLEK